MVGFTSKRVTANFTWKGGPSDEKNYKDEVREEGGEVDDLPTRLYSYSQQVHTQVFMNGMIFPLKGMFTNFSKLHS